MFNQSRVEKLSRLSLAALSVPILATSSLSQNLIENPDIDPISQKAKEAKKVVQLEKLNRNIKESQSAVKSIFGSESAKELSWIKSKEDDLLLRLSKIKLVPESEPVLGQMGNEIKNWDRAISLYTDLKELREDLQNPAARADFPDSVIRLEEQKLTKDTEKKLVAARRLIDTLLNSMRVFDASIESAFILGSFADQARPLRTEANQLLNTLRDPYFSKSESLRVTAEATKPVWLIGATGLGLAVLAFIYRSISQSRDRTERHFRTIKESQTARGTYDEQLQDLADATGNPVGGHKPAVKKRK